MKLIPDGWEVDTADSGSPASVAIPDGWEVDPSADRGRNESVQIPSTLSNPPDPDTISPLPRPAPGAMPVYPAVNPVIQPAVERPTVGYGLPADSGSPANIAPSPMPTNAVDAERFIAALNRRGPNGSAASGQLNPMTVDFSRVNPEVTAHIDETADGLDIPPDVARRLFYFESGANPKAPNGSAGEIGIGQIKPPTFHDTARKYGGRKKNILDWRDNVEVSMLYLQDQHEWAREHGFQDDAAWTIAAARYNAGPTRVDIAVKKHGTDVEAVLDEVNAMLKAKGVNQDAKSYAMNVSGVRSFTTPAYAEPAGEHPVDELGGLIHGQKMEISPPPATVSTSDGGLMYGPMDAMKGVVGLAETAVNMMTGFWGSVPATVMGLYDAVKYRDIQRYPEVFAELTEVTKYAPRTETGKRFTKAVEDLFQAYSAFGDHFIDKLDGSPYLQTAMKTVWEGIPLVAPFLGKKKGSGPPEEFPTGEQTRVQTPREKAEARYNKTPDVAIEGESPESTLPGKKTLDIQVTRNADGSTSITIPVEKEAPKPVAEPAVTPPKPAATEPLPGETSESSKPPLIEQGRTSSLAVGSETAIKTVTGEHPAVYKIVEAGELKTSHDPHTFAVNAEYPEGVQERQYHQDKIAQGRVIEQAQKFDPAFVLSDDPTGQNGPPIITPDGIVLGGNSRGMSIKRLDTETKNAYREELAKKAEAFGIDPKRLEDFAEPVLVRELKDVPGDAEAMRRIGSDLNRSFTADLGEFERAVSSGKRVSADTIDYIGSELEGIGDNATLRDLFVKKPTEMLNRLAKDGVLTPREIPSLYDQKRGLLTERGKDFIERALLGSVIEDPVILGNMPASIRNKISQSLPSLARIKSRGGEWDISEDMKSAAEAAIDSTNRGLTAEQYLSQMDLFGEHGFTDNAATLFESLMHDTGKKLKEKFRKYATAAGADKEGQGTFLEPVDPRTTFEEVFSEAVPARDYMKGGKWNFIKNPYTGKFNFEAITPSIVREAKEQSGFILAPGPIRLLPEEAAHIWGNARRRNEFVDRGFASPEEAVADVADGFTEIRKGEKESLMLVKPNGELQIAYVELIKAKDGNFYKVKTAYIDRPERVSLHKRELIWRRSEPSLSDPGSDTYWRSPGPSSRTANSNKPGRNDPSGKGQSNSENNISPESGEVKDALDARALDVKLPTEKTTDKTATKKDILDLVEKTFGVPVRNKVTHSMGEADGWFQRQPEIIRMKKGRWGSPEVLTHELAHHIDNQLKKSMGKRWMEMSLPKDIRKQAYDELKNLDYDLEKKRANEGFAEFMRHYLTTGEAGDPLSAAKLAPTYHEWFEKEFLKRAGINDRSSWGRSSMRLADAGGEWPKGYRPLAGPFGELREAMDTWYRQGALNRMRAQIDFDGRLAKDNEPIRRKAYRFVMREFYDSLFPLEEATKQAEAVSGKELPPSRNPHKLATYFKGKVLKIAETMVLDGMVNRTGNRLGPSLADAIKPAKLKTPRDIQDWMSYVVALRARNNRARELETGFENADIDAVIAKFKDRPGWNEAAEGVTKWSNGLLDWLVWSGDISPEMKQVFTDLNPIYIPFSRVFNEGELRMSSGSFQQKAQAIRAQRGSTRPIRHPMEAFIESAAAIVSRAVKTRIARSVADLADIPGMGDVIVKLPLQTHLKKFQVGKIMDQLKEAGLDVSQLDPNEVMNLWYRDPNYRGKDNVVSFWRNGEQHLYEVSKDLHTAMKEIDPQLPWIMKPFAAAARLMRLGATGLNFDFSSYTNPLRDAQTMAVTSRRSLPIPIVDTLRGTLKELTAKEGSPERRALDMGLEMATMMGYDRAAIGAMYNEVARRQFGAMGKVLRTLNPLKGVPFILDKVRSAFQLFEMAPRMVELETMERIRKEHPQWSEDDVFIEGFNNAQDVTVNFTKSGRTGRVVNEVTAFFNVAIQGPNKLFRAMKEAPARTIARTVAWITMPTLYLWEKNKDKEWWKNLPLEFKYLNWFHEREDGEVVRVPGAYELFVLGAGLPMAMLDDWYLHDPKAVEAWLTAFRKSMTPQNYLPTALQGPLDVLRNKDWLERDIEPRWMSDPRRGLPVEERKNDYTTRLAEEFSHGLSLLGVKGLSPIQIDYMANQITGGMWKRGLDFLEPDIEQKHPILNKAFLNMPNRPARQISEFYEELNDLQWKHNAGKLDAQWEIRFRNLNHLDKRIKPLRDQIKALQEQGRSIANQDKINKVYGEMARRFNDFRR